MGPIELSFDVTDALPASVTEGRRISISAWLFAPDDVDLLGERPVTMALLNGGSYDKRYFHFQVPGRSGYSGAEHLAGLGNIVLLLDHLGIGESSRLPTQTKATRQVVALANHAAVRQFYARLNAGELHPALPALRQFVKIGGGHSMGAMQTIVQQAEHRTYEAVMILGYTAKGVQLTRHGKATPASEVVSTSDAPDYVRVDRAPLIHEFHWDDVPEDVIAADNALLVEVPSVIGFDSIKPDIVRQEAGRIDTPVYICIGERDIAPDPHVEPAFYRKSPDITLQILPRSGHCHNFASTREQLWNRMHSWARSVSHRRG